MNKLSLPDSWFVCPDLPMAPVHVAMVRAIRFVAGWGYMENKTYIFAKPVEEGGVEVTIRTYPHYWPEEERREEAGITLLVCADRIDRQDAGERKHFSLRQERRDRHRARAAALACAYMFGMHPEWADVAFVLHIAGISPRAMKSCSSPLLLHGVGRKKIFL